ncbi:MAG: sulfatase-like hydrolase/transferase, partial [Phycisphaerae bacterium]|nr:sulfatase-like hydrolase/transferase [Phycisphaerae bacterium]
MLTLTLSLVVPAPATPAEDPPNIILILADDLGWTDVSGGRMNLGHGSDFYETPHLDRLAAEGMAFPHAYAAGANCSPTRAALMSGQYAPRTGVYTVGSLDRTGRGPEPPLR